LVNKGVLLMQAERLEEARAAFAQASAIDPLLPEALYNSG
jgi:Flp pilus assembly protein TadD